MELLFKISLIISIAGIFLLLLLSIILEPKLIKIKDIDDKLLNKKVKIEGKIFKIENYKDSNFQILSLKDETGKIDVTLSKIINITNNQQVIVIGTVQEYESHLQISADKIIK